MYYLTNHFINPFLFVMNSYCTIKKKINCLIIKIHTTDKKLTYLS